MPCRTCGLDGHTAKKCPSKPAATVLCVICNLGIHHVEKCLVRQQQIKDEKNLKAKVKRAAATAVKTDEAGLKKSSKRTVDKLSVEDLAKKRARDLVTNMSDKRADSHRDKNVTSALTDERLLFSQSTVNNVVLYLFHLLFTS
jgi:hypothetical protein